MLIRSIASLWLVLPHWAPAQQMPEIPAVCSSSSGTVALLDCLQNQQDILRRVLEYQQLVAKISEIHSSHSSPPPQVSAQDEAHESNPGMDRVNWFDQNLEVYAIVGNADGLTAYARLDGREYRLRNGDSIRLALVTEVHPRGMRLLVSGHEISIGLSGRSTPQQTDKVNPQ